MLKFQNSYEVYVGQNNETKKIEKTKIKNITSSFYDGATFTLVEGMWKGEIEKSMKVDVLSDPKKNKNFCRKNEGGASSRSYRLQKGEPSKILLGGSPPQRLINIEKSLGHRALLM